MSSYDFRADIGKTVFTNDHREVRIIGYNPNVGSPRQLIIQHNDGRPGTRSIFGHSVGGEIHNLRPPYLTPPFAKEIAAAEEKATRHDFRQNIGEIVKTRDGVFEVKIIGYNEEAPPEKQLLIQYTHSGASSERDIYGKHTSNKLALIPPPPPRLTTRVKIWRGSANTYIIAEERWNDYAPADDKRWLSEPVEITFTLRPEPSDD